MTNFSISPDFPTLVDAAFVASFEELCAGLPGWRIPLAEPEWKTVTNPFTGERMSSVLTRDPGPRSGPPIPERLPFRCVVLPSCEFWERHYLALDLAVSAAPILSEEQWRDQYLRIMVDRDLTNEPLFGGMDDPGEPYSLSQMPEPLIARLAEMNNLDVPNLVERWLVYCPDSLSYSAFACLQALQSLARFAGAENRKVFLWNVHPYYRADSGKVSS